MQCSKSVKKSCQRLNSSACKKEVNDLQDHSRWLEMALINRPYITHPTRGPCTVCHNYRNLKLSAAKFSQYAVYFHKNFQAKARDNAAQSAIRIVHHMYCLYCVTPLLTWRHCELDQRVIDTAVRQWCICLRTCQGKRRTLWTQI